MRVKSEGGQGTSVLEIAGIGESGYTDETDYIGVSGGSGDSGEREARAAVLSVLQDHFGAVSRTEAGDGWELQACGHRVLLRAATASPGDAPPGGGCWPFAAVECDDDAASERVTKTISRAARAALPV